MKADLFCFNSRGGMVKDREYFDSLAAIIVGCAYKIGDVLGCGFLEKVYEKSLALELDSRGLTFARQHPVKVYYAGEIVGDFFADILVENDVVVELKAVKKIENIHFAQCQNYLKATGLKLGLIINFG